jgi:hypothetical protein
MTQLKPEVYEGEWRRLANLAAHKEGSIHDDETAQSMGFRGGFVPGSTVGQAAIPGILARYGRHWMEGGWYTFKFVRPVYIDEEVREVAEAVPDEADISLRVESRDGRLCCDGSAGLGATVPWDPAEDGLRGADEFFPAMTIGAPCPESEMLVLQEDVVPMLEAAGDETGWYGDVSPWGAGLIPPERLMNAALDASRAEIKADDTVRNPGMWAEHALAVEQPMFLGQRYVLTEHLADKGLSGRTAFISFEFEVTDGSGQRCAVGRHKIKWIRTSEEPGDRD